MMSPRGPAPHRLPRGRPRDRRHAHRRAPTRCGRSRSSRAGMALGVTFSAPDDRPLQLRASPSCSRRSRSRSAAAPPRRSSSARPTHRRRVGHPAADRDRPPDGRPLGHERRDRPARRAPARRRRARSCRAPPRSRPTRSELIDDEVRRIVDEAHQQVVALLAREPRASSTRSPTALLEHETLDEDDAYAAAGVAHTATDSADGLAAAAQSTPRVNESRS